MTHEGMVHALRNIWRALRPDGVLIDLQPTPDNPLLSVLSPTGAWPVGQLDYSADLPDLAAAEAALASACGQGWFELLESETFRFDVDCDTLDDFVLYQHGRYQPAANFEQLKYAAKELLAAEGESARLRIRRRIRLRTYSRLPVAGGGPMETPAAPA
jgi:hypothetical protein